MPTTTRPGYAPAIPVQSITGRTAEVSATATAVQGDPNGPDGPRWLLHAAVFGPQGGRRGEVELILDPVTRARLVEQLGTNETPSVLPTLTSLRKLIADTCAALDDEVAPDGGSYTARIDDEAAERVAAAILARLSGGQR